MWWIRPIPVAGAVLAVLLWLAGGSMAWAVVTPSPNPSATASEPDSLAYCSLVYSALPRTDPSFVLCTTLAVPDGGWCLSTTVNGVGYFFPCSLSAPTPSSTPSAGSPSPSPSESGLPSASSSPSDGLDPGSSSSPSVTEPDDPHTWTNVEAWALLASGVLVVLMASIVAGLALTKG